MFLGLAAPALADPPQIVDATAERTGDTFRVSVTLLHADTGWEDYADAWRVVTEGGAVVGERILVHPHVEEQPFTRSLGGLTLDPEGTYFIEARSLGEGYGPDRFALRVE